MSTIERKMPDIRWDGTMGKVGGQDWRRNEDVRDAWRNLFEQGWDTITFVNLMPFGIAENFGQLGYINVPACPFGQAYAKAVLDQPKMDMKELGGARWSPTAVVPRQFAADLERKYTVMQSPPCGVFYYEGTGEPPKDKLIAAMEVRDRWVAAKYKQGQASWTRSHNLLAIDDNMKAAARYLHSQGLLQELPEWVITTKQEQMIHKQECDQCGELNTKTAKVCKYCEFPLNLKWVSEMRPDLVTKYPRLFEVSKPIELKGKVAKEE